MMKLSSTKKQDLLFLFLIFCLALFLRLYQVKHIPISLNWDEAAIGYNAYTILKTAKDEWGKTLPLSFRSFNDYKAPLLIYITVPFVALFGLTELAVRLPLVLIGSLTVLASYFLLKHIFPDKKNKAMWFLGSFLLAISPWHIHFTRAGFEASLSMFLAILGLIFCLRFLLKKDYSLILSALFFGLSLYAYHSAKVFIPLFILSLLLIYKKQLFSNIRKLVLPAGLLVIFFSYLFFTATFQPTQSRAQGTLIFFDQYVKEKNQYLFEIQKNAFREAQEKNKIPLMLWNKKPVFIFRQFANNYFKNLSPPFLLSKEAPKNFRMFVGDFALFSSLEFGLIVLGIIIFLFRKEKHKKIIFAWLFLAVIPPSLSMESPHPVRGMFFLYALLILISYAFISLSFVIKSKYGKNWSKAFLFLGLILWGCRLLSFSYNYLEKYPEQSAYDWQYGMKQVMSYVSANKDRFDEIYISNTYGQAYIFYLFYSQELLSKEEIGQQAVKIGKLRFVEDPFPNIHKLVNKYMLVSYAEDPMKGKKITKKVYFPNGKLAFLIYENQ